MPREKVWVVFETNGTTDNAEYTCDHVCVTVGAYATVCKFTNGLDAEGRKVKVAVYAKVHSVVRYEID